MTDAPERIWADPDGQWWRGGSVARLPEYVRADIHAALQERVERLEEHMNGILLYAKDSTESPHTDPLRREGWFQNALRDIAGRALAALGDRGVG